MSTTLIHSDRFEEVLDLVTNWDTQRNGSVYRDKLEVLIGFKPTLPASDFKALLFDYLVFRSPRPTTTTEDPNDPLPDSMKEPDPEPVPSPDYNPNNPLSIWNEIKSTRLKLGEIGKFMNNSKWDRVDHRNIPKPLSKTTVQVQELINELIIDDKYLSDVPDNLRALIEITMKAFLNWWETTQPKPKRFGDL
jgi:hypothetical protein